VKLNDRRLPALGPSLVHCLPFLSSLHPRVVELGMVNLESAGKPELLGLPEWIVVDPTPYLTYQTAHGWSSRTISLCSVAYGTDFETVRRLSSGLLGGGFLTICRTLSNPRVMLVMSGLLEKG